MIVQEEFQFYKKRVQEDFFSNNHGKKVLEALFIEELNNLNEVIEQESLNTLLSEQFIKYLAEDVSIQIESTKQFFSFISYLYFKVERNICSDILMNLVDSQQIQNFLKGQKRNKNNVNQFQNKNQIQHVSDFTELVGNSQQLKQSSQQIQYTETHTQSRVEEPQQKQLYQQFTNQLQKESSNVNSFNKQSGYYEQNNIRYSQNNNHSNYQANRMNYIQNNMSIQNSMNNIQNSNISQQQNDQVGQQFRDHPSTDNKFNAKQMQFNQYYEDSLTAIDPISEIKMLEDKWKFFKTEFEFQVISGTKFTCSYSSEKLKILPQYSEIKSKKKDAQKEAARKILPHLQFYLKFQQPYFSSIVEEQEYLLQKSNNNNNQSSQKQQNQIKSDNSEFDADQKMLLNYQDDRQAVYTLVSMYERNLAQEVLSFDDNQKEGEFFKCVVTFQKGRHIITQQGLGGSKKAAKQVAFMKLNPLLQKFYNPDTNIDELNTIHQRKNEHISSLKYNQSVYQVDENNLEDY